LISFKIFGSPVAQGRGQIVKCGQFSKIKDPDKSKNWKQHVALIAQKYHQTPLWSGPIAMELTFEFLKSKSTKKSDVWRDKSPDIDNLQKGIFDALNKVIYEDDRQIVSVKAIKIYSVSPGVQVKLYKL